MDIFEFLSAEFAACSLPPTRVNHRKAFHAKTQQRDQEGVELRSRNQSSRRVAHRLFNRAGRQQWNASLGPGSYNANHVTLHCCWHLL